MTDTGAPAPHDIFTDNHRWGDLSEWNRTALALHEQGGIQRIERDGFDPFWAVIDHAAVLAYPLQVILRILGLPEEDYPRMLTLTQQLFGQEDPDLQREELSPEVQAQVIGDFYEYFTELTAARRTDPTDDLASLIADGTIDDEPMPDLETMGYYVIVATAGHDTTSSTMAGGLQALIELAGEPSTMKTTFVGGHKTLPIRYRLT